MSAQPVFFIAEDRRCLLAFSGHRSHERAAYDTDGWCARMFPERIYEAPRSTGRLMPPTDLRPSWLQSRKKFWSTLHAFQKGERLIFGPMLHALDRPFFLLVACGVNRRCNRLQIDQICGRMMPEVRR